MTAMTRKAARDLAERTLRYGYSAVGRGGQVRCPICPGRHNIEFWPPTDGSRWTRSTMVREITDRILDCVFNETAEAEAYLRVDR